MGTCEAGKAIKQIAEALACLPEPSKYPEGAVGQLLTDARCGLVKVMIQLVNSY